MIPARTCAVPRHRGARHRQPRALVVTSCRARGGRPCAAGPAAAAAAAAAVGARLQRLQGVAGGGKSSAGGASCQRALQCGGAGGRCKGKGCMDRASAACCCKNELASGKPQEKTHRHQSETAARPAAAPACYSVSKHRCKKKQNAPLAALARPRASPVDASWLDVLAFRLSLSRAAACASVSGSAGCCGRARCPADRTRHTCCQSVATSLRRMGFMR